MSGADARLVRQGDVRAMLGFIADLASLESLDEFRGGVLPGLRELVPSEIVTYNEVDFPAEQMIFAEDPPGSVRAGTDEAFVRLGQENPLVMRYQRTRDGRPYKWSDLITRRELHRTELYREIYAGMGVEYQMAFCLPAPPELIIGIALNRGRTDFSERDRELLNLIRGPMIQAYRTVQRYAEVVDRLAAVERGLASAGVGIVVLERTGSGLAPAFVSDEAARGLEIQPGESAGLPPAVGAWLFERESGDRGARVDRTPLVHVRSDGSSVAVQLMPARRRGEPDTLLVEPAGELVSIPTLRAAGLTEREAEVLRLVALGRSNAEVASSLAVRPRTVDKHLQNIYEKLGARSRTQAVLTAWSIARPAPAQISAS
jgi:DNA-binding CsgD family transcriptional regulator